MSNTVILLKKVSNTKYDVIVQPPSNSTQTYTAIEFVLNQELSGKNIRLTNTISGVTPLAIISVLENNVSYSKVGAMIPGGITTSDNITLFSLEFDSPVENLGFNLSSNKNNLTDENYDNMSINLNVEGSEPEPEPQNSNTVILLKKVSNTKYDVIVQPPSNSTQTYTGIEFVLNQELSGKNIRLTNTISGVTPLAIISVLENNVSYSKVGAMIPGGITTSDNITLFSLEFDNPVENLGFNLSSDKNYLSDENYDNIPINLNVEEAEPAPQPVSQPAPQPAPQPQQRFRLQFSSRGISHTPHGSSVSNSRVIKRRCS